MTLGPLEYIIIGFKENRSDGKIAHELEKLVASGTIRIVDLVFVGKDNTGHRTVLELSDPSDERIAPFARLLGETKALLTPEDVQQLADSLEPGTAGLAVLFEHRWAEDIKRALAEHGGVLVTRAVIPPEVLEELGDELDAREPVLTR
jgi:Family of unknown function (DUF6325)